MIIPCVHNGDKIKLKIKYFGKESQILACPECVSVIKESNICEVIS